MQLLLSTTSSTGMVLFTTELNMLTCGMLGEKMTGTNFELFLFGLQGTAIFNDRVIQMQFLYAKVKMFAKWLSFCAALNAWTYIFNNFA